MESIKTVVDKFIDAKNYKDQFINTDIKNIISNFIQLDDIVNLYVDNHILYIWLKSAIVRHIVNINNNQIMKLLNNNGMKIINIIIK